MNKRKLAMVASTMTVAALLCYGCASAASGTEASDAPKKGSSEWAELYPLQYSSFATLKDKEDTEGLEGHFSLQYKLLAPAKPAGVNLATDEEGNYLISGMHYDEASGNWVIDDDVYGPLESTILTQGCFACKTTNFDDLVEQNGEGITTQKVTKEFVDQINAQIWDCGTCHSDDPTEGADANLRYFNTVAHGAFDQLAEGDRACGQCHNASMYGQLFKSGEAWESYDPWKYGFDADSFRQAADEYGMATLDEATGIETYVIGHTDLEFTQGSMHSSLGVTCTSCHMPQVSDDASGEAYTDHNASQSPLENETALEYCLSCHENQGITSTEDMAAMVRTLQDEEAAAREALAGKLQILYDAVKAENETGTLDEASLDRARDLYAQAKLYMDWGIKGNASGAKKVVHNPDEAKELLSRAQQAIDEAMGLLEA